MEDNTSRDCRDLLGERSLHNQRGSSPKGLQGRSLPLGQSDPTHELERTEWMTPQEADDLVQKDGLCSIHEALGVAIEDVYDGNRFEQINTFKALLRVTVSLEVSTYSFRSGESID